MLQFYRDRRARFCHPEEDGDMLLYQWGVHDWGQGKHFELDVTRQVRGGALAVVLRKLGMDFQGPLLQLSLTYEMTPTPELAAIGSGNVWCSDLEDLEDLARLEAELESHPAFLALQGAQVERRRLVFEMV